MKARFNCTQTVTVECSHCGAKGFCHTQPTPTDQEFRLPDLPKGWILYTEPGDWHVRTLCPKHRAELKIVEAEPVINEWRDLYERPPEARMCTRFRYHDGPCNGYPRESCHGLPGTFFKEAK